MSKSWDEEAFLNFHIHWKKEEKKKRILGISLWGSLRERKTSSLVLGRAFLFLACAAEIQGPTLARFVSSVAASLYQVLLVLTVCSPCSACVNWWYWLTTSSKLHCLKCNGDHLCIIYLKKKNHYNAIKLHKYLLWTRSSHKNLGIHQIFPFH